MEMQIIIIAGLEIYTDLMLNQYSFLFKYIIIGDASKKT